jgi:hypothetical protein
VSDEPRRLCVLRHRDAAMSLPERIAIFAAFVLTVQLVAVLVARWVYKRLSPHERDMIRDSTLVMVVQTIL